MQITDYSDTLNGFVVDATVAWFYRFSQKRKLGGYAHSPRVGRMIVASSVVKRCLSDEPRKEGAGVVNDAPDEAAGRGRRSSSRLPIAIKVTLSGTDVYGNHWAEQTLTQKISRNGCCVVLYTCVEVGSFVEIVGAHHREPVRAKVVYVAETDDSEVSEIGLHFQEPVDFWGIRFPQDLPHSSRVLPAPAVEERPAGTVVNKGDWKEARPAGIPAGPAGKAGEQGRTLVSDIIARWFQQETTAARERLNQALESQAEVQRRILARQLQEHAEKIESISEAELLRKVEALINDRLSAGEIKLREVAQQTEASITALEAHMRSALSGVEERISRAIDAGRANMEQHLLDAQGRIRDDFTRTVLAQLHEKKDALVAQMAAELHTASRGTFREVLNTLNQVLELAMDSVGAATSLPPRPSGGSGPS